MSRMSQKLLIFTLFSIFLLIFSVNVYSYKYTFKFSLTKAPDGTPLHQPMSIFVDSNLKRIYVVDTGNNRLVSFNFKGEALKEFDAGGTLKGPIYMLRDNYGYIWVVERPENKLAFIDIKGHKIQYHTLSMNGHKVLIDRILIWKGNLLVLDRTSGTVLLLDKNFLIKRVIKPNNIKHFSGFFDIKLKGTWLWGIENMGSRLLGINLVTGKENEVTLKGCKLVLPVAFDIDQNNNIYILDRDLKKIFVFDEKGKFRYSFLKEGFRPGQVRYPWDLVVYKSFLFIVDEGNGRIDVWGL